MTPNSLLKQEWLKSLTEVFPTSIDDRDLYSTGMCHVLSAAFAEDNSDWRFLVVRDGQETYETSDRGEIPGVIHVYAMDAHKMAWDIFGIRSIDTIQNEVAERFGVPSIFSSIEVRDLMDMMDLVTIEDETSFIDRPLTVMYPEDIQDARVLIATLQEARLLLQSKNSSPSPD